MSSFDARLRLPGHTKLPLGVIVDISHERITLTAGDRRVGGWLLEDVEVVSNSDGFHLRIDSEELVLNVTDSARFAKELGLAAGKAAQRAVGPTGKVDTHRNGSQRISGMIGPNGQLDGARVNERWAEDVNTRIAELEEALTSDAVSPAEVFARWLKLLKEVNRRHGQGSIPTDLFYRLNTRLLDLIPEPSLTPEPAA
jgi:hypothetical protein